MKLLSFLLNHNKKDESPLFCSKPGLVFYLACLSSLAYANLSLLLIVSELAFVDQFTPNVPGYVLEIGRLMLMPPAVYGLMLSMIASMAFVCRLFSITERYSTNSICRIQVFSLAVLAFCPLATFAAVCANLISTNAVRTCVLIMAMISNSDSSSKSVDLVAHTGTLTLIVTGVIVLGLLLKAILFPRPYLSAGKNGLAIGAGIWKSLIGERQIAWDELVKVSVSGYSKSKRVLKLKLKNGNYSFAWDELQKSLNPSELMSDIKTYAHDAVDASCIIKNEASSHEYTELWLKYFTSSSTRNRSGGLQPGERLHEGRYEIAGELGQGGQGTAYLASDGEQAATTIVLKEYILPVHRGEAILHQSMQKLHHEAEILGKIHHPNIVELKDTFVEDHRGYLVLEYVEGHVLKQMVQSQGPQPEELVIDIALQVCDALAHLHSMDPPVIHRDITPDNLILQPDGGVKLVDFNVAQHLEASASSTVVGKHAFIPPEQFRGKPTIQSDIFALGGTLFFLLTGKEPEPLSVSHPSSQIESVNEGLDAIVARATALDQTKRFTDANEFRQALLALAAKPIKVEVHATEQQLQK